jgi:hypothetical protein
VATGQPAKQMLALLGLSATGAVVLTLAMLRRHAGPPYVKVPLLVTCWARSTSGW